MEDKYLPEEQWERMFRNKREMDRLMHERAEYEIMARVATASLVSKGNRAERRKQAARARKARP